MNGNNGDSYGAQTKVHQYTSATDYLIQHF